MASQQEEEEKLEFAARLSALLLNEGTDVMRWFLMDNIPRRIDEEPNLQEVLSPESFFGILLKVLYVVNGYIHV